MDRACQQAVGLGRFAVAPHEGGIAVFRGGQGAASCQFSADGVRWEERSVAECNRSQLQPTGRPRLSAGNWYESPPEARDLTIVRDERSNLYRAFFCARRNVGRRLEHRGCIGAASSPDLREWTTEPPIFAPNLYPRLFSPHAFSEEGRAVLFYTTAGYGDLRALRFAVAPHLEGPYERMEPDVLACDIRTSVATVPIGPNRLVFFGRTLPGETAATSISRPGLLDFRPDGRPFVRFYDRMLTLLQDTLLQTGASLASGEPLIRVFPRLARDFRMTARVRGLGAKALGVLFRTTITGHDNITLWLDFEAGAILLRRGVKGRLLARTRRPVDADTEYHISVWAEGGFADVYLDDEWILSTPTEARRSGGVGLAVYGGEARFEDVAVRLIRTA